MMDANEKEKITHAISKLLELEVAKYKLRVLEMTNKILILMDDSDAIDDDCCGNCSSYNEEFGMCSDQTTQFYGCEVGYDDPPCNAWLCGRKGGIEE